MDLAAIIPVAIRTSIFLIVFALGLGARLEDALYLFRRPAQLARSLLAMNVIMPVVAAALAAAFNLYPAVKIALLALAVSPLPPHTPEEAARGRRSGVVHDRAAGRGGGARDRVHAGDPVPAGEGLRDRRTYPCRHGGVAGLDHGARAARRRHPRPEPGARTGRADCRAGLPGGDDPAGGRHRPHPVHDVAGYRVPVR